MRDCETCCGFGGTFLVKFGDIFLEIAWKKCVRIVEFGVVAVVLGDFGCMFNIEGWLRSDGDTEMCVLYVVEVCWVGALRWKSV